MSKSKKKDIRWWFREGREIITGREILAGPGENPTPARWRHFVRLRKVLRILALLGVHAAERRRDRQEGA